MMVMVVSSMGMAMMMVSRSSSVAMAMSVACCCVVVMIILIIWKLRQVLVGVGVMLVVQLHKTLSDTHASKDTLCVANHKLGVGIHAYFYLQGTNVIVGRKSPKVRLLDTLYAR